jgi:MFS family permease
MAFGVIIDRLGDRRVLFSGIIVVVIGDALVTRASSVPFLMAARTLQGLGYIALTVAGATFVLRTTMGEHRRKAMALWAAHTPAGFAAAILLVTPLAAPGADWRWAFWGHALVVAALGPVAWAITRSSVTGHFGRSKGMLAIVRSLNVYRLGAASLGSALLQTGLMTVLVSHVGRHYGTPPPQAALYVLAAMTANLLGALIVVFTPVRKTPVLTLLFTAVVAAIAAYLVVSAPFPDVHLLVTALILFTGSLGITNSLIWSFMPNILPRPEASGALGGFITQATFLGVLLGPPVFFWLANSPSSVAASVVIAFLLILMLLAIPAAVARPTGQSTPLMSNQRPA